MKFWRCRCRLPGFLTSPVCRSLVVLLAIWPCAAGAHDVTMEHCQNEGGLCKYHSQELEEGQSRIWCVHNRPLLTAEILRGGIFRLFDVQLLHIRGSGQNSYFDVQLAAEDSLTWLTRHHPRNKSAQDEVLHALSVNKVQPPSLKVFANVFANFWADDAREYTAHLPPYLSSCVGINARKRVNLTIDWRRTGPLADDADIHIWMGPILFVAGVALFIFATPLAESVCTR